MMILLVAAAIGNAGFQVVRAVALIRLGSHTSIGVCRPRSGTA